MSNILYSSEEMRQFLINFIDEYRKFINTNQIENPPGLADFSPPCQIHVIWFSPYDQQYFFVTKLNSLPDKEIIIIKTNYKEATQDLQTYIDSEFWPKEPAGIFDGSITEVLTSYFGNILNEQPSRIFKDWVEPERQKVSLGFPNSRGIWICGGFHWEFRGILDLDLKRLLNLCFDTKKKIKVIEEKKDKTKEDQKEITKPEKRSIVMGAYAYPTLWIGTNPFQKLEDYCNELETFRITNEIALETKFREFNLRITKLGLFYLENAERDVVNKILNVLMSLICLFSSYSLFTIKKDDIGRARFNITKGVIESSSSRIHPQKMWFYESPSITPSDFAEYKQKIRTIEPDNLDELITKIGQFHDELDNELCLWLESFTLLSEKAYNASFMVAWTLLESLIILNWKNHLNKHFKVRIDSDKRRQMWDSPIWTISIIIRSMQISGQINDPLVNVIEYFRKKRNDLIHKTHQDIQITDKEAISIINLLSFLIQFQLEDRKKWNQLPNEAEKFFEEVLDSIN